MFNTNTISNFSTQAIKICYILLFFFTPLVFTAINSELFEFNKMILTYILAILIAFFWGIKMIAEKRIIFKKTFWDIPILLFFVSQFLSTIFSHDVYMSLYGYYSRFNQGLFSLTAYLILYFAFVSNIRKNPLEIRENHKSYIKLLIYTILLSSLIVSAYGIAQHFGIDFFHWVQDVKTRVFSSLGQPNWLGAYLTIILLIYFGLLLPLKEAPLKVNMFYLLPIILLYTSLLFTRSRSSFAAFHICFLILTIVAMRKKYTHKIKKLFISTYIIFFLLINVFNILPTPIEKINQLTIPNLINKFSVGVYNYKPLQNTMAPAVAKAMAGNEGGTESFAIRKIVWNGALDTFIANPILGYGTETYALAHYRYKSQSQNLISEWDFLYNKAHNEYLNYLATTGIVGFATYLFLIISFIIYFCRGDACRRPRAGARPAPTINPINLALFLAWLSILITNFVGFSVIVISIFFYMIPAFIVILNQQQDDTKENLNNPTSSFGLRGASNLTIQQLILSLFLLLTSYFLLHVFVSWWLGDTHFALAEKFSNQGKVAESYIEYKKAIDLSPQHPNYHNEFSIFLADMSASLFQQKNTKDLSRQLAARAIAENTIAIEISPESPIFFNNRALIFHNMRALNKTYPLMALDAITKAKLLAPRDPKITYYMAIYRLEAGDNKKAILALAQAVKLKPNYVEASVNFAKILKDAGQKKSAVKTLQNLLKYYPDNENIVNLINEYRK